MLATTWLFCFLSGCTATTMETALDAGQPPNVLGTWKVLETNGDPTPQWASRPPLSVHFNETDAIWSDGCNTKWLSYKLGDNNTLLLLPHGEYVTTTRGCPNVSEEQSAFMRAAGIVGAVLRGSPTMHLEDNVLTFKASEDLKFSAVRISGR